MKKVVKIATLAALAVTFAFGTMSCSDSIEDDKPEAAVSTQTGANNNEDDPSTPATPSPSEDPDDPTPESPAEPETPSTPETPAAKVTGSWDFTTITSLDGVSTDGKSVLAKDVDVPSTGDAKFTLLANKYAKPKFNTGLQLNTGSKAFEIAKITAVKGAKVTVKCVNASKSVASSSGTTNAIEISFGSAKKSWTDGKAVTDSEETLTYTMDADTLTISGSGVKILEVKVE